MNQALNTSALDALLKKRNTSVVGLDTDALDKMLRERARAKLAALPKPSGTIGSILSEPTWYEKARARGREEYDRAPFVTELPPGVQGPPFRDQSKILQSTQFRDFMEAVEGLAAAPTDIASGLAGVATGETSFFSQANPTVGFVMGVAAGVKRISQAIMPIQVYGDVLAGQKQKETIEEIYARPFTTFMEVAPLIGAGVGLSRATAPKPAVFRGARLGDILREKPPSESLKPTPTVLPKTSDEIMAELRIAEEAQRTAATPVRPSTPPLDVNKHRAKPPLSLQEGRTIYLPGEQTPRPRVSLEVPSKARTVEVEPEIARASELFGDLKAANPARAYIVERQIKNGSIRSMPELIERLVRELTDVQREAFRGTGIGLEGESGRARVPPLPPPSAPPSAEAAPSLPPAPLPPSRAAVRPDYNVLETTKKGVYRAPIEITDGIKRAGGNIVRTTSKYIFFDVRNGFNADQVGGGAFLPMGLVTDVDPFIQAKRPLSVSRANRQPEVAPEAAAKPAAKPAAAEAAKETWIVSRTRNEEMGIKSARAAARVQGKAPPPIGMNGRERAEVAWDALSEKNKLAVEREYVESTSAAPAVHPANKAAEVAPPAQAKPTSAQDAAMQDMAAELGISVDELKQTIQGGEDFVENVMSGQDPLPGNGIEYLNAGLTPADIAASLKSIGLDANKIKDVSIDAAKKIVEEMRKSGLTVPVGYENRIRPAVEAKIQEAWNASQSEGGLMAGVDRPVVNPPYSGKKVKNTFGYFDKAEATEFAKLNLREAAANSALSRDRAFFAMGKAKAQFDKQTPFQNYEFIDKVETAQGRDFSKIADKNQRSFAETMARVLDERRDDIIALGKSLNKDLLNDYIDNYFPHIWKDPDRARTVFAEWTSKRPLGGSGAFLKKRTIPTTKEGLERGLDPVSNNPVDLVMLKLREMDKFIVANSLLKGLKDNGYAEFVKTGAKAPQGWRLINDKISNVFYRNKANEVVLAGHYYVPSNVAGIINNHLSPGLRGYKGFRGYLAAANALNQVQLGFSAFHLGFTSVDATVSKLAVSLNALAEGKAMYAAARAAEVPIAPIQNVLKGRKIFAAAMKGTTDPFMSRIIDGFIAGGGRLKTDAFYATRVSENMMSAFRQGNIFGGLIRIPGTIVEQVSRPIMEYVVPRQKLGVFFDLARLELERNPNMSQLELQRTMAKIWDSVDNRMGQLVYDNLFWNAAAKDLGLASVRSLGWNIGTFRELGGGGIDAASFVKNVVSGKKPELTYRMAYTISLPIVTGSIGAMIGYLMTGKPPKELKDYFFPVTGYKNAQGNDIRISLPSYVKDVYHYSHNFPQGAQQTLINKLHPVLGITGDMLDNQDYYGTKVRNEDDPLFKQLVDIAAYPIRGFQPYSVQGLRRNIKEGQSGFQLVAPFIGMPSAPAFINRTEAQSLAYEYNKENRGVGGRTSEEAKKGDLRATLRRSVMQLKDGIPKELYDAYEGGKISELEFDSILRSRYRSPIEWSISGLALPEAIRVYAKGTDNEKVQMRDVMLAKAYNYFLSKSTDDIRSTGQSVLSLNILDGSQLNDPKLRTLLEGYLGNATDVQTFRRRIGYALEGVENRKSRERNEREFQSLRRQAHNTLQKMR